MDFIDKADEYIKRIQLQMEENFFYKITGETDFKESNLLLDLKKCKIN